MPKEYSPATLALVEKLRRFRGRLTTKQMVAAMGLSGIGALLRISQLIRDHQIATADLEKDYRPGICAADARVDLADRERRKQIALARHEMSDPLAKPYKPGKMEW